MSQYMKTRSFRRRLMVQALEDRAVPAIFTVNALTDTGAGAGLFGDLRYCMAQAQAATSAGADTINFDLTVFESLQGNCAVGGFRFENITDFARRYFKGKDISGRAFQIKRTARIFDRHVAFICHGYDAFGYISQ